MTFATEVAIALQPTCLTHCDRRGRALSSWSLADKACRPELTLEQPLDEERAVGSCPGLSLVVPALSYIYDSK